MCGIIGKIEQYRKNLLNASRRFSQICYLQFIISALIRVLICVNLRETKKLLIKKIKI